jgi:tRNA(fMet)-specific endonuclease VapC
MELRFGTERHANGRRLWERIAKRVLRHISILPLGFDEAAKAGEVLAALESSGLTIGLEDVLIGSTALVYDLTVATRNVKHFARIDGLLVEDWWD